MLRYETLFLTVPTITSDEISAIESQFAKLVKDNNGSLISYERWGKYRLAYSIEHHDYGVYFLARFEMPATAKTALLGAIETFFMVKHNELVIRHIVSCLPAQGSLEYNRPHSLEEGSARETSPYHNRESRQSEAQEVHIEESAQ